MAMALDEVAKLLINQAVDKAFAEFMAKPAVQRETAAEVYEEPGIMHVEFQKPIELQDGDSLIMGYQVSDSGGAVSVEVEMGKPVKQVVEWSDKAPQAKAGKPEPPVTITQKGPADALWIIAKELAKLQPGDSVKLEAQAGIADATALGDSFKHYKATGGKTITLHINGGA